VDYDSGFEHFCDELNDLRGRVELYRTREGLVDRIMASIRDDRQKRFRARLKEWITPALVCASLLILWRLLARP